MRFCRQKTRFAPKDNWVAQPQQLVHQTIKSVCKAHKKAHKARKVVGNTKVDMSPIEVEDADVYGIIMAQLPPKQGMKE